MPVSGGGVFACAASMALRCPLVASAFAIAVRSSSAVVMLSSRNWSSCCASVANVWRRCCRRFTFRSYFSCLLRPRSEMVYVRLNGGIVSGVGGRGELSVVLVFSMLPVVLGIWSTARATKGLSSGSGGAAVIILILLPLTTVIHPSASCSLSCPYPPHRQPSFAPFLSSLGLCFGHLSSFPFSNSCPFK